MDRAGPVLAADPDAPLALRARARWAAALTRFYSGTDFPGSGVEAGGALAEAVGAGDAGTEARCHYVLALADLLFRPAAARATAAGALPVARAAGDEWTECALVGIVVASHLVQHRPAAAARDLAESTALTERTDARGERAWADWGAGQVAAAAGAFDAARAAFHRCLRVARALGDPVRETYSVDALSAVALETGRFDEIADVAGGMGGSGRPLDPVVHQGLRPALQEIAAIADRPAEAADALARTGEFLTGAVDPASGPRLMLLGATVALATGDAAAAARSAGRALELCRGLESALVGPCRVLLARIARAAGDPAAEELVHADLAATVEAGLHTDVPDALDVLGGLAVDAGDAADIAAGARLLAAADALSTRFGRHRWFAATAELDRCRAADALGPEFDRLWGEGAALDVAAAVAYARRARGRRGRPDHGWDALTPTELEVVRLVAAGLSNDAVAQRLFVARSTVKTHLLHVFAKLGVGSRAELAARAVHRGLGDPAPAHRETGRDPRRPPCPRADLHPAVDVPRPPGPDARPPRTTREDPMTTYATTELVELTVAEAGAAIARGDASPVELTRAYLDRIAAIDPVAHLAAATIDTDTGGSIRIPASFSGCVGLKPTYGRVSTAGVVPLARLFDTVGPLARTVEDAAILLGAIAGYDPADAATVPDLRAALDGGVAGLRIGVPRSSLWALLADEVRAVTDAALEVLAGLGAILVEVELPDATAAIGGPGAPGWVGVVTEESRHHHRRAWADRRSDFGPDLQFLCSAPALSGAAFAESLAAFRRYAEGVRQALTGVDLLASPATPIAAPPIGAQDAVIGGVELPVAAAAMLTAAPFNLAGVPAVSVPCGLTEGGLPVGLQLAGRPFDEATVLRAAHAYEQAGGWDPRSPV
ncbi:MAG: amidase family protein [Pseudonocardia sp.]